MLVRDLLTSDGPEEFSREALAAAHRDGRLEEYLEEIDVSLADWEPHENEQESEFVETAQEYIALAQQSDDGEATVEITPGDIPVNALEPSLTNKPKSGPIGEALDLDPYGTGINRAVDMGLILDRNTPDRRETTEQSLSAAADAYREVVVDGNADPAEIDRERLQSELESQADPATGHEDDNDTEGNTEATSSPLLEEIDAEPPEEYEGTDVWMTELPQFGDEKRDLDDFFQENWLALVPPSNWVLRAAGLIGDPEDEADGPDGEHSGLWVDELAADETPLTDGPSGFTLEDVVYPPTNALAEITCNIGSDEPATSDLKVGLGYDQIVVTGDEETGELISDYEDSPYVETGVLKDLPNDESLWTFHFLYRLFGYLPTIHPSEHPALTDSVSVDHIDSRLSRPVGAESA